MLRHGAQGNAGQSLRDGWRRRKRERGEWGERQVGMCGESKMELEKRRGSREQGMRGNLSHTLTHTHSHSREVFSVCGPKENTKELPLSVGVEDLGKVAEGTQ